MNQDRKCLFHNRKIEKEALDGLRGILSLHIMVFHAQPRLFVSSQPLNIYAAVDMPIFFLLSGFSLAVSYGMKSLVLDESGRSIESKEGFDYWQFYKNRCIRILPLHYLGLAIGFICWKFGYDSFSNFHFHNLYC